MYQLVAALIHAENFFPNSWGRNFFQMQLLKHQFMLVPPPSYTGLAYTYTNLQQIKDKCVRWIFQWSGRKNCSRGPTVVKFDFINSKLRERHF